MARGFTPMLIDGHAASAADGRTIDVVEPATAAVMSAVPRGGREDVRRATTAAIRAGDSWSRTPAAVRGRILALVADDLEREVDAISLLLARETGNAIRRQSRPEILAAVDLLRYFGGVASEVKGETVPLSPDLLNLTEREPVGVIGAMTPWNAPVQLAVVKSAMALITGNTIVLKASEEAPLAVLAVGDIFQRHLPPGVLNIVTGTGPEAGDALLREERIAKFSFTGSTDVGRLVMEAAAKRVLPVSLELGGKSPSIVFPDAEMPAAIDGIVDSMRFARQGQSCTAGTRLLLHRDVYDEVLAGLITRLDALVIGDPIDERTDVGSIINATQHKRVSDFVAGARELGAAVVTGGADASVEDRLRSGFFYRPTILSDVEAHWPVVREEIFGPVMVALPWSSIDEAVKLANDSVYGLAAYVWSQNIDSAIQTARRLEAGWVQVNRGLGQLPGMSYGGVKASGIGQEFSIEGAIESFTHRKTITIGLKSQ